MLQLKSTVSRRISLVKRLILMCLLVTLLVAVLLSTKDSNLELYMLDVGQGDSVFIKTPDKKNILIDAGPDEKVLSELSKVMTLGERKIDYVIITHPDLDHVGGLPEILKRYEVGYVLMEDIEKNLPHYLEAKKIIKQKKIISYPIRVSDDFIVGCCVKIDILWPKDSIDIESIEDVNDISTVLEVGYIKFNAFFGGDLSSEFEEEIARNNLIDFDLLKVGHHGSTTSTSKKFLKIIKPEISIIGVGSNNSYGHPSQEVINNLNESNSKVMTTSENGRIKIETDGKSLWYSSSKE